MVERLVLWDIDGTLVRGGPVSREVFDRAVEHVLGRHPGDHGVLMSGKTDPQIALEILLAGEMAEDEGRRHVPTVLERLESELAEAAHLLREGGRVMPGVEVLLPRLHDDPAFRQTVLTGNIAGNAAVKVAAFGLDRWLDLEIGAYGSDHHDRTELVPIALERARRLRGVDLDPHDVWVVGDTPRDLACARAGGARCLLVATGRIPFDELDAAGADVVLDDLADVDGVLDVLAG